MRPSIGASQRLRVLWKFCAENRSGFGTGFGLRWLAEIRCHGTSNGSSGGQNKYVSRWLTRRDFSNEQFLGTMEVVSLGAIAIGLINVGSADAEASSTLLQRLLELTPQKLSSSTYSRLKMKIYSSSMYQRELWRSVLSISFFIVDSCHWHWVWSIWVAVTL